MIRNFIYLDSEKLRSLSSQLFEGVTESLLKRESQSSESQDSQKGPIGSGQVLADIFREDRASSELSFLEDHAYTLFENKITESGTTVVDSNSANIEILGSRFVRVTGLLHINDTKATVDLISNFNRFGLALTRVTNHQSLSERSLGKGVTDKDIERVAKEGGMQMDAKFIQSLAEVMDFSFSGMLEFKISQAGMTFSSPAKRDHLRESENLIIQKYSRLTEQEFTLFGVVTQTRASKDFSIPPTDVGETTNLRAAVRALSEHMRSLEDSLSGIDNGEIIVDPIAVYQTLL